MAAVASRGREIRSSVLGLVIIAAVLYVAKEVLLPLALAILVAFLLAPLVERLERLRLGRVAATFAVALVGLALVASVGTIAGVQAVSLAAKLPEYRHTIAQKVRALRHPRHETTIGKAAQAIKDIEKETQPEQPPMLVKDAPASGVEALGDLIAPIMKPAAMALAVVVFTILLLLHRENLRERLIALVGARRINVTTRALAEIATRVSSYLAMLTLVNACFGIAFGAALALIGIPNALLFGLLGALLRFVPYVGVWLAAALPVVLAIAIADGWSMALWTIAVFLALEALVAYLIEPWLYGKSAGLSPVAIIAALLFWTWLWGTPGLLVAMPLTVCVAVVGRHIPELGYLNILLGDEPVLAPCERLYERLVALDGKEAAALAAQHVATQGAAATFDTMIIPALALAARDARSGVLEPARARFVFETARRIVETLQVAVGETETAPVCVVAAGDAADHVAALALARLVGAARAVVIEPPAMVAEVLEIGLRRGCRAIVISSVALHSTHRAGYLARRLRRNNDQLPIIVGLWAAERDVSTTAARLRKLGVNEVVTRLSAAADILHRTASAPRIIEAHARA